MIKKVSKILVSILLIVVGFGLVLMPIRADSGWDSDYDSGGWDSGSDWGSDWDSDYDFDFGGGYSSGGSYSGVGGISFGAIVIAIIIIIIVVSITKNKPNGKGGSGSSSIKSNNYNDIDVSRIISIAPNLNIGEFKMKAFNIYRDIQTAWMNFDTDTIRMLTTDEIYNMYCSQLETLKLKKQKNIMSDISLEEVKVINVKKAGNVITIDTYIRVKCYDYVIKESTGETVRGKDNQKIIIEYVISFVKSSINDNKEEKCPNCGAPVEMNGSSTCPYCDSTLVKDSSDYVMSKKTCVGQQLDR